MKKRELTLFEDFTTLRWVRWIDRKPNFNGSIYVRYNGKNSGDAIVHNGLLMSLHGDRIKTKKHTIIGLIPLYTPTQISILKDLYWLEEIIHKESMNDYYIDIGDNHTEIIAEECKIIITDSWEEVFKIKKLHDSKWKEQKKMLDTDGGKSSFDQRWYWVLHPTEGLKKGYSTCEEMLDEYQYAPLFTFEEFLNL